MATNESAIQVLGTAQLATIAHELLVKIRESATIDWTIQDTVPTRLRVMVRRIRKKRGPAPDARCNTHRARLIENTSFE